MFYTTIPPAFQVDRVRLLPGLELARSEAGHDARIFAVAVRLDASHRRLVPLQSGLAQNDPAWETPVEQHADGSLTAKGTIPVELYVDHNGHQTPRLEPDVPNEQPESWHVFD